MLWRESTRLRSLYRQSCREPEKTMPLLKAMLRLRGPRHESIDLMRVAACMYMARDERDSGGRGLRAGDEKIQRGRGRRPKMYREAFEVRALGMPTPWDVQAAGEDSCQGSCLVAAGDGEPGEGGAAAHDGTNALAEICGLAVGINHIQEPA